MARRVRSMVVAGLMVGVLVVPTAAHAEAQGPGHAVVVPAPACDNILGNLYNNFPYEQAVGFFSTNALVRSAQVDDSNC